MVICENSWAIFLTAEFAENAEEKINNQLWVGSESSFPPDPDFAFPAGFICACHIIHIFL